MGGQTVQGIKKKEYPDGSSIKVVGKRIITRGRDPFSVILICDKPIYKPGDVAFFSCMMFNPINYNCVSKYMGSKWNYNSEINLQILDGKGTSIHSIRHYLGDGRGDKLVPSFAYNIPEEAKGGIYTAKANIYFHYHLLIPNARRTFRIREYHKPTVAASKLTLHKQVYFGGDTIKAILKVRGVDGNIPPPNTKYSFLLSVCVVYIYIYIR